MYLGEVPYTPLNVARCMKRAAGFVLQSGESHSCRELLCTPHDKAQPLCTPLSMVNKGSPRVHDKVYNAPRCTVPPNILRLALAPHICCYSASHVRSQLYQPSTTADNMLTAVSSWEPHPAYLAAQDTSSPASSCYSSPTQSIYGRTNDELEAAEALLILSRSAPARQYYYHPYQAGPLYQYPGPSYSQAGISYQLVGPAQPGIQTPPVQSYERAWAAPTCASVEEQPVAGPSVLRGSGASSPRLVPKARSTSPAPEEVRTPSPRVKRSRSPTPASTTTKPHSTASSIGPQRTAKSRGKARASPVAAAPKETKSGKRKTKAKSEPKEPVMYNADDPRPYYIDRAEWIGLDLETGKPMPGVPPLKSPATEYQAHILAWIFENVTPQPDKFWKAVVATKLSM